MGDMSQKPAEEHLGTVIGRSLRAARRRAGLTMDALAELTGVSQPHLSQMENGRTSPSISTLYRLANALGVTAQELLPDLARDDLQVIKAGSVPTTPIVDSPAAAMARVLVGAPDKLLQVQDVSVAPGQDLGQWFSHEGEEFLYLVRGSIRVELIGRSAGVLTAGDAAWYDSSIEHRWQLAGDEPAQLIAVSAVASRKMPHSAGIISVPQ
jgi:quercetin dioxygenase-like cupin family protein/DNA-binding XRE family transcriptional regulator